MRNKIIAVLVDKSTGVGRIDLVFTTGGIFCDKTFTGFSESPAIVAYKEISLTDKQMSIGNDNYKNKGINMVALNDLIQELAEMSATLNSNNSQNTLGIPCNEVYMIESN